MQTPTWTVSGKPVYIVTVLLGTTPFWVTPVTLTFSPQTPVLCPLLLLTSKYCTAWGILVFPAPFPHCDTASGLYCTSCTWIHYTAWWDVETLLFKWVKSCSQTLWCLLRFTNLALLWDSHNYPVAKMLIPEPLELCSSTFGLVSNISILVVKYF